MKVDFALQTLPVKQNDSGAFIELADLVSTHLRFEDTKRAKYKQCSVANISEWLQDFAVHVSIIAGK